MDLLNAALAWHAAGFAVLPVKDDGSKAPAVAWKQYQEQRPSLEQVAAWFTSGAYDGLGILTGAVSGNAEMLELEGRAVDAGLWQQLQQAAQDNGLDGLLRRVADGYAETTPSGGLHLIYRCSGPVDGNAKLARTAERDVLAETRGEGGFVVVAPSGGRTHPTGKAWTVQAGTPSSLAVLDPDERGALLALARLLDQAPAAPVEQPTGGILAGYDLGLRPGDDYDQRTTWQEILEPRGWRRIRPMGRGHYWAKPDKSGPGGSATTGQAADGIDRLYVFSTSTEFEPERPYTKFAAYALLEHGGDYHAAASALAALGYGKPATQSTSGPATAPEHYAATAPVITVVDIDHDTLAMSEDGHSQALIAQHSYWLRYCPQMGRWLHWGGSRWDQQPAGGGLALEMAKSIARAYPDDQQWRAHKKRSLSRAGVTAALGLAQTDYRIAVHVDQLDAKPWELNTPGGIVDLRTGQLRDPDPASLHTRSTLVAPDPEADPTAWLDFLATTFQGDGDLIAFVQRLLGYGCVGTVREAILPVFHGQGANGKTVLLETVQAVLGDYATVAPQKFLVQGPTQHATEVAALAGARLVVASETNEGERFDEAKVKILTGGDRLKARFMRQDEFTFIPSHLLVLMTNHRPEVASGGPAFWRRVREVPFLHVVPEHQRDPELKDRLVAQHGPAIMAWLAQGAAMYARDGLREPAGVKAATAAYEKSTDTVSRFVEDMVILGGGDQVRTASSAVRAAYEDWCRGQGETPVSAKALTTQLCNKHGIEMVKGNKGVRFLAGMTLASSVDDEANVPPAKSHGLLGGAWGGA